MKAQNQFLTAQKSLVEILQALTIKFSSQFAQLVQQKEEKYLLEKMQKWATK